MQLKQFSKRILIVGTLTIWTIKFIVRPLHVFDDPTRFFLGIAPNLFGSFLIPFGAYWFFSNLQFRVAKFFWIHSIQDLRIVCAAGFGMLVINEYLQLIPIFGRTFDLYDLVSSVVGLFTAYFIFGSILQRQLSSTKAN
jgi:hypothetical protein